MRRTLFILAGCMAIASLLFMVSLLQARTTQPMAVTAPPSAATTVIGRTSIPIDNTHNNLPTGIPELAATPSLVLDLAPQIADRDKIVLHVRRADGAIEEIRGSADLIEQFRRQLPSGDRVILVVPPLSVMEQSVPDLSGLPATATVSAATPSSNPQTPVYPAPQTSTP